ncbi:MAG: hypothetical protein HOJ15_03155 [Candidatus Jacksonbacteria bacterium]|jgi:hypothetical protein|nr:hypothetical protein [Candidatus Jacksonbacteria bacterium]MBT6955548.1 hypothetical protein [Candidatus Jacksonbacteria bacterium]MBT7008770.1 hypothetical protein [Candidatus Jacksonbacteria bacterium]
MQIHNKNKFTVVVVAAFVVLFLSSVIAGYISVSKKDIAQAVHGTSLDDERDAYVAARDADPYDSDAAFAALLDLETAINDVNLSISQNTFSISRGGSFTLTGENFGRMKKSDIIIKGSDPINGGYSVDYGGSVSVGSSTSVGDRDSMVITVSGDGACSRRVIIPYWETIKNENVSTGAVTITDVDTPVRTKTIYLTVDHSVHKAKTGSPTAESSWRTGFSSARTCNNAFDSFGGGFTGWLHSYDETCSGTNEETRWCEVPPDVSGSLNASRVGGDDTHDIGGDTVKIGSAEEIIRLSGKKFFAGGNVGIEIGGIDHTSRIVQSSNSTIDFTIDPDTPLCSDEIIVKNIIPVDQTTQPQEDREDKEGFLVVPKVDTAGAVSSVYITRFTPDSGSAGTVVQLTGGFGPSRSAVDVLFNETPVEFFEMDKPWTPLEVYPLVPRGAETGKIKVIACAGGFTAESQTDFTVTEEPAIFYFDPLWGEPESAVEKITVYGENFDTTLQVKINNTSANYSVVSEQEIEVTIPATATTGKITVCKAGDCIDSVTDFYVQSVPPYQLALKLPEISNVTPRYYESGNRLVINGRNLSSTLLFGDASAVGTVNGAKTRVTVFVPAGANGLMKVCNNNGCTSDHFFHEYKDYDAAIETDSELFVSEASGGSLIRDESIEAVSNTEPGTACNENNPSPQILSVSTSSEYVGHTDSGERNEEDALTISGCHFGPSQYSGYVLFNNTKQLNVISWGKNSIRTAVPFDATSGHLSVVAWTGQHGYAARASSEFNVKPVIQKLGLNRAAQGQIIDILGSDFCPPTGACSVGSVRFGIYPGGEDEGVEAKIYAWSDKRIRVAIQGGEEIAKDWGGGVKIIRSDGVESRPEGELEAGDGREQLLTLREQSNYFYRLPRILSLSPQTIELDRAKLVGINGDGFWGDKNIQTTFVDEKNEMPTIDLYRTRLADDRVNQGTSDEDDRQYQTYASMSVPTTIRNGRQSVVVSNWDGSFAQARPSTSRDMLYLRAIADADMSVTGDSTLLTITGGLVPGFHLYGNTLLPNIVVASTDVKPSELNILSQDDRDRERNIQSIQLVFPKEDADANRFRNVHVGVVQYGDGEKTGVAWIRQEQTTNNDGDLISIFDDILEYNDIPGYERCNADGEECVLLYPGVGGNSENDVFVGYGYMSPNPLIVKLPAPVIDSLSKTQFQSFKGRTSLQQRDSHHVEPITVRGKNFRTGTKVFVDNKNVAVTVTPTVLYIKIPIGELTPGRHTIKAKNTDGEESNYKFIQVR